jgi:exoribonuclease R
LKDQLRIISTFIFQRILEWIRLNSWQVHNFDDSYVSLDSDDLKIFLNNFSIDMELLIKNLDDDYFIYQTIEDMYSKYLSHSLKKDKTL